MTPDQVSNCPGSSKVLGDRLKLIFDDDWYAGQLTAHGIDVEGEHLLRHFRRAGSSAFLSPHPLFDPDWYVSQNEEAQRALAKGVKPFDHFMSVGHVRDYWPHPLFDVPWYKRVNGLARDDNALCDFAATPAAENRSTHPHFDAAWYRGLHVDPQGWTQPAILHFVRRGQACGYKPNPWGAYDARNKIVVTDPRPYKLSHSPLVSIIVVNLNGERHLRDLLPSLKRQSFANFELVLVDNGSTDRSVSSAVDAFPTCKIIRLETNKGFAEASNIGYRQARGELIALLNNDTIVGDTWLEHLVGVMQRDVNLGAVCPKIRFAERFCALTLRAKRPFVVDDRLLLSSLAYKKIFAPQGSRAASSIASAVVDAEHVVELRVPAQKATLTLKVTATEQATSVALATRHLKCVRDVSLKGTVCEVSLEDHECQQASFVINNAGGDEPAWLTTADIGFGRVDDSQFSYARDVALLCGCSALVRRDALLGKELFLDAFVAYFEDSELSQRLRRAGFRIRYCPEAVVYHQHSATTIEHSPFWTKQVYRNRILYRYFCSDHIERERELEGALAALEGRLRQLEMHRPDGKDGQACEDTTLLGVLPALRDEVLAICAEIAGGEIAVKRIMRVGIFNAFWNTLGGGEAHALACATYLAEYYQVELISVEDFDIDHLTRFFDVRSGEFVKRLVLALTPSITAEYDVFINSSYMNECPSLASRSWYLVSFPSSSPSREFLGSYHFIANSRYTRDWMTRYWGSDIRASIVNPSVSTELVADNGVNQPKERVVLSVGRFFRRGHSKNQAVLASSFRRLWDDTLVARNWKLVFIGSVGDLSYVDDVRERLSGVDFELITNASTEVVRDYYGRAAVYVHAAGLGEDPERSPANFEHFGMTVAEATANGCFPIVYDAGGPAEIVDRLGAGIRFRTIKELEAALLSTMLAFPLHTFEPARGREHFSRDRLYRDFANVFAAVLPGATSLDRGPTSTRPIEITASSHSKVLSPRLQKATVESAVVPVVSPPEPARV